MNRLAARCAFLSVVATGAAAMPLADAPDGADDVVKLAPFVVQENADGLSWQFASVNGFEILTLCSESLSREFVEAQARGALFLPESLQDGGNEPVQVVLWGGKRSPLKPTRKRSYLESGYDFGFKSDGWFIPNVIARSDGSAVYLSANLSAVDSYEHAAIHYARSLLERNRPVTPLWLKEGLVGTWGLFPGDLGIQSVHQRDATGFVGKSVDLIRLPCLPWPADFSPEDLIPWNRFFTDWQKNASMVSRDSRYCAQAGLLLRWALFGSRTTPDFTRRFWMFVAHARSQPTTGMSFQAVFGIDDAQAEAELVEFARRARAESPYVAVPHLSDALPAFAHLSFRSATEGEIARLKGNFERMEMLRLRSALPQVASTYEAAARRTVARGLRKAADDPKVHELAGLLEYETGHPDAARPHLDYAFAHHAAGTPALLALARLRLADMRIGLPADGKLSVEALDRVLTPLFAARARKPPVLEIYQMIAEVWAQSAVAPTKRHLAVLFEGAQFFRDEPDYIVAAIELHRRHGYTAEADALLTLGETWARDDAARARYAALRTIGPAKIGKCSDKGVATAGWSSEFQTALFGRWSPFGSTTNGRNRDGYWAFAEVALHDGATEAVFRECYGMNWAQACAEMRAYLKPKNVGVLELRMPHVMADVPEAERMEFRDATLEEARRVLGDFNWLRVEQAEGGEMKENTARNPVD
ncbi:MAG: hypothetical protein KF715_12945 [Candidatus Didemnitutus sp.]|nr:hypothetical protein [Candidatus Didemnitutus sp.]